MVGLQVANIYFLLLNFVSNFSCSYLVFNSNRVFSFCLNVTLKTIEIVDKDFQLTKIGRFFSIFLDYYYIVFTDILICSLL